MRSLLVVALCALFATAVMAQGTWDTANTPADGADPNTGIDFHCALDGLKFTNGMGLFPTFARNQFHYQCVGCNFIKDQLFQTVATPHTMENVSYVEVKVNGQWFMQTPNAISNNGDVSGAPNTHSNTITFQPGLNTIQFGVTCQMGCYYIYTVQCEQPPQSFVVGDPQFIGLRGQSYQVHGVSGEVYNIVSDADFQYNSRFVFLDAGECPVINGKKTKGCWSHPGSYLGELGLKTKAGDKIHLATGSAKEGFTVVEVNGKALAVGETVLLAGDLGAVSVNNTHQATVSVGAWEFTFENSDHFVNQRVYVKDTRSLRSHGLLGQTWRETTYANAVKYVQGQVDDYVIRDGDIFGDNFVFNTFN